MQYDLPPEERDRNRGEARDPWWYLPVAILVCAALAFFVIQSIALIAF